MTKHAEDRFENLDSGLASPMFEKQGRIMSEHNIKSVLDIGCRLSRPLEYMSKDIKYHGFDIIPENKDRLEAKFPKEEYPNTEWKEGSWDNPPFNGKYDCLIFGGVFYYNKEIVVEMMETYIKKYNPRLVLICDIDYKTPAHWWAADFSDLKTKYHHREHSIQLRPGFYGMDKRVIFEIDLSLNKLIVTNDLLKRNPPLLDPTYIGFQAPTMNEAELLNWVYVINTEPLDNISKYMNKDFVLDYWIGVAAGFKPYYTLTKFGTSSKTRIIYADVSAREIDWRKWLDINYDPGMSHQQLTDVFSLYKENNPSCEFIRGDINEIGQIVDAERDFLNISDDDWKDTWQMYRKLEKIYLHENIIDNIDNVLELVKPGINDNTTNCYVWTSNAWDWHQFRYTEADYNTWQDKVKNHVGGYFWSDGKVPPFSSMK
jgi:hypothetical protein